MCRLISSLIALSLFTMACATSPMGRKQLILMPSAQMQAMGAQSFEGLKKELPLSRDAKKRAQVDCIAKRIVEALEGKGAYSNWEVKVFREESPNAFALPGRKIGVHEGLFKTARNSDQLATVIAHEVGHVIAKHGNERVSQALAAQTGLAIADVTMSETDMSPEMRQIIYAGLGVGVQVGVLLPYSRHQESEADLIGLELMARAGFNPHESVQLWKNMAEYSGSGSGSDFLSTHPSHHNRIKSLQRHMEAAHALWLEAKSESSFKGCE